MTLKDILTKIGQRHGVDELNPMQKAVAQCRARRIILLAPTGSGKTLAFTVPMVEHLKPSCGKVQAVVIAPSRELVIQIADVIRPVASGYKTVALYGGHQMSDEVNSLTPVPDIVVATPGRLLDHINRGTVDVTSTDTLVLDEYDKALELGFHDQMRRIVRRMRHLRYVMLTSATPLAEMPDFIDLSQAKVLDFASKTESPRTRMKVALVRSDSKDKLQSLAQLLEALPDGRTIVFVNHRESAERVYNYLRKLRMPVGLYHGGLDQLRRELAIDMLNNGTTPILVSTDLGARGLDIDAVQSVVHYHLPPTPENWTHRNGRTARVDATGNVYILVSEGENIPDYIDYDYVFNPAVDIPDADATDAADADGSSLAPRLPAAQQRGPHGIHSNIATVYFNAGKKEKISKGDILGFITKQCGIPGNEVGKIIIKDHCAVAAVPRDKAAIVEARAKTEKIKGQRVRATLYM